jgi:hypothetical protein
MEDGLSQRASEYASSAQSSPRSEDMPLDTVVDVGDLVSE